MGRQSLKAGYEFQHINVEVQDVNPLYGLDSYTGQFTRPAGASASNLYNLADFMLGLRSQYALSTFLVANMEQDLHFTYVQDDIRVNDKLTINAGLRYEYATPMWEANNLLTNFDPVSKTMIRAKDGSISDRALVDPDRNNFGPRLGFAYTPMARTVVRGGWGTSYVHVNRIGSANLLGINGPQVVRAAINQTPTTPGFIPTEQGYPAEPDRFDAVQPAHRARQLHPARFPFEPGPELARVGAARVRRAHAARPRVRREQGERSPDRRQLQPGRAQQFRGHDPARGSPSDPDVGRHHVCLQRRQVALRRVPDEVPSGEWAPT